MIVVGPVDWLVLKRLGRQPWTWVTTSGWIALVTLAAIMMGSLVKSGDLHFRTTTVIDEADRARVAELTFASIYSPRTTDYATETDPQAWWSPAADVNSFMYYGGGGGMRVEVPFHQDFRGNTPDPMLINVWNSRMLAGETLAPAAAIIDAKLSRRDGDQIVGTIANRSDLPLKNVQVRVRSRSSETLAALAAGETKEVTLRLSGSDQSFNSVPLQQRQQQQPYYNYPYAYNPNPLPRGGVPSLAMTADVAARRSGRIDALLGEFDDLACVYAEFDAPSGALKLKTGEPIEAHRGVVRALVNLE
jgi:hypothetical protein